MSERAPKRPPGRAFDFVLHLGGVTPDVDALRPWLDEWVAQNRTWRRVWAGARGGEETLLLADEFEAPPQLRIDGADVVLQARVRADSTLFRDWMAKLASDFSDAHPGTRLERVEFT